MAVFVTEFVVMHSRVLLDGRSSPKTRMGLLWVCHGEDCVMVASLPFLPCYDGIYLLDL